MSLPQFSEKCAESMLLNTRGGEKSEYSDLTVRSTSPAIHLQLQQLGKDSSLESNVPDAFKSRPKLSRTPPDTCTNTSDNYSDDTKLNVDEYIHDTLETYQSDKINSPSLSIEYPPGSSIPMIKKRKKFQFKKSHYQKFIGTSSAKKTKEMRKSMEREKSRSNSLISYQSSAAISFPVETLNDLNIVTSTTQIKQDSLPPSPPSDDLLSQMKHQSPNKLLHSITTSSHHVIPPVLPSEKSVYSDEITVSSSPSVLQDSSTNHGNTRKATQTGTSPGYSHRYRSRQKWKTLIHDEVQKRQRFEKTTSLSLHSSRAMYREYKKNKHVTFGAKTEPKIDPDQIRIRLNEYDEQKGQNLEDLFRPQKTCWSCVLL